MFIDCHALPDGHRIEADLVVIGAGPAGITLARELNGSGIRIALLEAGGMQPTQESQQLYEGDIIGWPAADLRIVRLRYFGGTSNHWVGFCRPYERIDFEARRITPHGDWPINNDELDPYYERAQAICQLGPYNYGLDYWEQQSGLSRMPFDEALVETKLVQYSNPTRFGPVYETELEQSDNITVYLNANVLELEPANGGTRVSRALIATYRDTTLDAVAETFVVACGGLENPRLLLNSRGRTAGGLANGNDLVGRFFSGGYVVDTSSVLLGRNEQPPPLYMLPAVPAEKLGIPDPSPLRLRAFLCLPEDLTREEDLCNMNCELYPINPWSDSGSARESWNLLTEHIARFRGAEYVPKHLRRVLQDLSRLRGHDQPLPTPDLDLARYPSNAGVYSLHSYVEQLPNPHSRVTLSRERDRFGKNKLSLDVQFTSAENRSIKRLMEIFAQAFGQADIGRVRIDLPHDAVQLRGGGATHHQCTTRMHDDPRYGVVDRNCRSHEVENLYLGGCSVFTRAGVWNPTLTIVALSVRMAEHLREYFNGR